MNWKHETSNGYVYDKRFFWGALLVCCFLMLYIFSQYGWDFTPKFYTECRTGTCVNPYYDGYYKNEFTGKKYACEEDWCKRKYLTTGEYGTKEPPMFKGFMIFTSSMMLFALCMNHYALNKGKRPGIKLNLPESWNKKISKWAEGIKDE